MISLDLNLEFRTYFILRKRYKIVNLINEPVVHRVFGVGSVASLNDGRITIQFAEGTGKKMFSYPDAFNLYMKMSNSRTDEFVSGEVKKMLTEIEEQHAQQAQERLDEVNRRAAEKAAPKKPRQTKVSKAKN
jgi:hypothetical protein